MKDILAGAAVGVSQTLVGHPFDTAKTLIQNKKPWIGLSFSSYYKGWRFPLVAGTVFNCTVFPIYERTVNYTQNSFTSGFLSGIIVSPFVYAFDVGKIKQQTSQTIKLSDFYKTKGLASTYYRETLAMGTYFGSYFYMKEKEFHPLISGGVAGLCNWTLTYPLDSIRSRQIAQNITIKESIQQGKIWKGYSICAVRAVIVNAISFWVYETVKNNL
tara:strand:+ start:295 stop:939 length:645 start_codon:yes stop_codon:yes gene_type:complete